jgi:hypothetical protein
MQSLWTLKAGENGGFMVDEVLGTKPLAKEARCSHKEAIGVGRSRFLRFRVW